MVLTCRSVQAEVVRTFLLQRKANGRPVHKARVALAGVAVVVTLLAGRSIGVALSHRAPPAGPACRASDATSTYPLDREQARNASTIAAVGKRMGLADHAVTIAMAAALQESKLHNLSYGDRDSVGLFQQRPSQGWGTRAQILVPAYASRAFYRRLIQLPAWETMPVTDAAQAVQHSGAPDAYAQWEKPSRIIAQALTGEVAAGFACRAHVARGSLHPVALSEAEAQELGSPGSGVPVSSARGWTVAAWLIGHATEYGIASVSFAGQRWQARTGGWAPHPPAQPVVTINGP